MTLLLTSLGLQLESLLELREVNLLQDVFVIQLGEDRATNLSGW